MEHLLTLFGDVNQEEGKCTNIWRHAGFHLLTAPSKAERYIDEGISTDTIFCNKAIPISYDTFPRHCTGRGGNDASHMH